MFERALSLVASLVVAGLAVGGVATLARTPLHAAVAGGAVAVVCLTGGYGVWLARRTSTPYW